MKINPVVFGAVALALAGSGCAHKGELSPEPTPAASPAPASVTPVTTTRGEAKPGFHYVVRKGDSLWSIAAKPGVLGDPFRWPILFKQNRDQIQDPDLIETRQDLDYGGAASDASVAQAIQEAKDTPPYAPHAQARKTLPLNY